MIGSSFFLTRRHFSCFVQSKIYHACLQRQPCSFSRLLSTSSNNGLVLCNVDDDLGVAMLTMNRPPANSLSLEMNEAISSSIKNIENNHPKVQSVILASSNPKIFSAGLDVSELISPDDDRLPKFWNSLQQVYIDLYGTRLATIAVIQGHAPAAGCMLAMACDYRIMYAGDSGDEDGGEKKKKHVPTIGLNETKLGIAAPPWMGQLMVRTIGFRPAELALALGTLFPPNEALKVGLVDKIISSSSFSSDESVSKGLSALLPASLQDQASNSSMQNAYKKALLFSNIPPQARVASKLVTREWPVKEMELTREADLDHFCTFIRQEAVQDNLMAYVNALKAKKVRKNDLE